MLPLLFLDLERMHFPLAEISLLITLSVFFCNSSYMTETRLKTVFYRHCFKLTLGCVHCLVHFICTWSNILCLSSVIHSVPCSEIHFNCGLYCCYCLPCQCHCSNENNVPLHLRVAEPHYKSQPNLLENQ